MDTNGDGRELWFGLDLKEPSGGWYMALDWEDVDPHRPVGRVDHVDVDVDVDVVFGWGTGEPDQRRIVDFDGVTYPIHVDRDGWWLLVVANTDPGHLGVTTTE